MISSFVALALGRPELNTTSDIQYWLGACLGCMANSIKLYIIKKKLIIIIFIIVKKNYFKVLI